MSEQQTSGGDVVVVTGAGQGIGYAIAERFSAAGATVIITDINEQTGSEAARKLSSSSLTSATRRRSPGQPTWCTSNTGESTS